MRLANGDVVFFWPLALHVLTAGWLYSDGSTHSAIDLRAAVGTPVYAAEDGTVEQTQDWDGHTKTGMQSYGIMCRIRHADYQGGALSTRYAHLSRLCVQRGEQVREGQLIGYSGETGNCFGAHLHFEVIWKEVRRNPLCWLDADFTCANSGVYTYGAGQGPVQRPAQSGDLPAGVRLQRLCIIGTDAEILAKARSLGLPADTVTALLIGPASDGDAMTLWQMAGQKDREYFARYTKGA